MAYHVNFPVDHPLHAGFQYHSIGQNPVLAEADVILVLDSDVPWIPSVNRRRPGAAIYYVDIDPVKSQMQLWDMPARRFAAAQLEGRGGADRRLRPRADLVDDAVVERSAAAAAAARHRASSDRAGGGRAAA